MSLSAAEKLEVIRLVEESELPVKRTLAELGVSRSKGSSWAGCGAGSWGVWQNCTIFRLAETCDTLDTLICHDPAKFRTKVNAL